MQQSQELGDAEEEEKSHLNGEFVLGGGSD